MRGGRDFRWDFQFVVQKQDNEFVGSLRLLASNKSGVYFLVINNNNNENKSLPAGVES